MFTILFPTITYLMGLGLGSLYWINRVRQLKYELNMFTGPPSDKTVFRASFHEDRREVEITVMPLFYENFDRFVIVRAKRHKSVIDVAPLADATSSPKR